MANHLAGEVAVKALGRELVFRLGVNEMLELQNALGMAGKDDVFLSVFDEDKLRNLATVRTVAFCGFSRVNETGEMVHQVTELEAGDVVVEVGLEKFGEVIQEALRWALPEKEPVVKGGPPPRPSSGPTSSTTRPGRVSGREK